MRVRRYTYARFANPRTVRKKMLPFAELKKKIASAGKGLRTYAKMKAPLFAEGDDSVTSPVLAPFKICGRR